MRGTGQGERGPDADRGSYDALAYWCRSGIALEHEARRRRPRAAAARPGLRRLDRGDDDRGRHHGRAVPPRAHRRGHDRRRLAARHRPLVARRRRRALAAAPDGVGADAHGRSRSRNPLVQNYETKDERFLSFCCLQGAKYWPGITEVIGRPELATDRALRRRRRPHAERAPRRSQILAAAFAERTAAEWRERLASFAGQWVLVQDTIEAAIDPQTVANGYVVDCATSDGTPFKLVAAPGPVRREAGDARRARPSSTSTATRSSQRAGPRLGRDPRPQGPRSRRLILKAGTRLKSAVCTTEVMVDRGAGGRGRADVRRRADASAIGESGGGAIAPRARAAARRSASAT